ncbi:DUF1043 domain-containing protein [Marinomonas sp. C2222]|uniref:DUF1043 domain-containing protein n=1 Tax=Marinomonas sargassi TaxID=2984494 RepID=A0ABT2YT52_9GAMM|nr:DUF1043 domain-containing protein [Marinomonas sargassi]MCV2403046.1 DUF1043 domain-containing protein [Marinomonas sargassi]
MNLEEFNIIIFITGVIFGCIATSAFKGLTNKNSKKATDSASDIVTMTSLQQEIDNKQALIDNFFTDSNEKIIALEKQITSLKGTLTSNAKTLNVAIEGSSNEAQESIENTATAMPPLDYAPKTEEAEGMLSESFGLENKDPEQDIKRGL